MTADKVLLTCHTALASVQNDLRSQVEAMRKTTTQTTQLAFTDEEFFEPLDAIHRNEDAKIGFARKTGEMQEKFEGRVSKVVLLRIDVLDIEFDDGIVHLFGSGKANGASL